MKQDKVVAHVADEFDQSLLAEVITDEAIAFIEKNQKRPFFCYIPHAHVHKPRYARPEYLERAEGNVDRAHVEEVDDSIGRVLQTLKDLKLDQNTLVIFTSDNGPAGGMGSGPLRGAKGGGKYEGHMRVPTLAWWPETIPSGSTSKEIGVTTDLLPTLAKLTRSSVPDDRIMDGKDISGILLGKKDAGLPTSSTFMRTKEFAGETGSWLRKIQKPEASWSCTICPKTSGREKTCPVNIRKWSRNWIVS